MYNIVPSFDYVIVKCALIIAVVCRADQNVVAHQKFESEILNWQTNWAFGSLNLYGYGET